MADDMQVAKLGAVIMQSVMDVQESPLVLIRGALLGSVAIYKVLALACGRPESREEFLAMASAEWDRAFVRPDDASVQ